MLVLVPSNSINDFFIDLQVNKKQDKNHKPTFILFNRHEIIQLAQQACHRSDRSPDIPCGAFWVGGIEDNL